ncbi:MAG TPA: hypothetical protein VL997_07755 [Dyella sp.]|nr:hypothetical protein [Dyella sp.]
MIRKARDIVMQSTEWLSVADLVARFGQCPLPSDTLPDRWTASKQIFAIDLGGVNHFPSYGLAAVTHGDVRACKPKPILANLLAEFGDHYSGWQLAAWFASANAYLDGARPMDMLDREPERVIKAAKFTAQGIQHG